jgi:DivIVA domain-containing protein
MNDNSDLLPNLSHDDAFEVQLRGYSRRQVDEFLARCRSQIRDLEQRLERSHNESEELRHDLATARQQALGAKPAHQEVSERIAQILKLADDEARSEKTKAQDEISQQRNQSQAEAERVRAEAREQAERMLTAAQEQAERAITGARAEAEKTRNGAATDAERMTTAARTEAERVTGTARAEAERVTTTASTDSERMTSEAQKKADSALNSAKTQAKKALDEATARATAIHDGAERRLNHLSTRHSETIKRLTDILDGVGSLVAAENARPSLEDEVSLTAAKTMTAGETHDSPGPLHAQQAPGQLRASGPRQHQAPQNQAAAHSQPGQGQPAQGQPAQQHQATARQTASQALSGDQPGLDGQSGGPNHLQSSPLTAEAKRSPGKPTIDDDEQTEGIRIVPTR